MTVCLDTDVVVDILRRFPPAVAWLESLADTAVLLPGYVVLELIQGCLNQRELRELERQLSRFQTMWPSSETCQRAVSVFAECHLSSGIELLDVLIGMTAAAAGTPLCTFNEKHYRMIPGLKTVRLYPRHHTSPK
jgi:predicted nucleic acid-binding protein